jgi:hypothetical protein
MADGVSVSFGFDQDGDGILDSNAVFEQTGDLNDSNKDSGFWGPTGIDRAAQGFESQLGNFFLRQSNAYKPFGVFHILYDADNPVTSASGEIWDIDGGSRTEQFLVKAFNEDLLLESILSPLGTTSKTLDGKPWTFGFNGLSDITRIEITFTGSKTNGIGLAFNNFSPVEDITQITQVPEPSTLAILVIGVVALVSGRHKQQHHGVMTRRKFKHHNSN